MGAVYSRFDTVWPSFRIHIVDVGFEKHRDEYKMNAMETLSSLTNEGKCFRQNRTKS